MQTAAINIRQKIANIPDIDRNPGVNNNNIPVLGKLPLTVAHILPDNNNCVEFVNIPEVNWTGHHS